MIFPSVTDDPFYPLDYGYTPNDFLQSYNSPLGGHVPYGLFPYLDTRTLNTSIQVENSNMKPVIKYISDHRLSDTEVLINAYIETGTIPKTTRLKFAFGEEAAQYAEMYDDGQHQDGEAGDKMYGGVIDNIPENTAVYYQVSATDVLDKSSLLPCDPAFIPGSGGDNPPLFINEFMASNDMTIADEYGEYDDWIEVFNAGDQSVWLGNKYLTDNLTKPSKWRMPEIFIEPGEFLLFWADDDPEQGMFHTNFKLDKEGEEIGIFNDKEGVIDQYVFGQQQTDISKGRMPDADDNWIFFEAPTPRVSNELTSVIEIADNKITMYPNPVSGEMVYFSEKVNFQVYNSLGALVHQAVNSQNFNISSYNNGLHFVVMDTGQRIKLIIQ
jgi:hypothetical protein